MRLRMRCAASVIAITLGLVLTSHVPAKPPTADIVDGRIADLIGDNDEARQAAHKFLRKHAAMVLPRLKLRAASSDPVVRGRVEKLLKDIEGEVIPKLIARLTDKDLTIRVAAGKQLAEFGPAIMPQIQAAAAIAPKGDAPAFKGILDDMETLQKIENLIERLSAPRFKERTEAAKELTTHGTLAVGALLRATLSNDPEVSLRAKAILEKIAQ